MAEVDGNLTARKTDGAVELHWQGKFRGPDFPPINFQLKTIGCARLKDSKGRTIPSVMAVHLTDTAQDAMTDAARRDENLLLADIAANPSSSMQQSTAIKGVMADRQIMRGMGTLATDVAGSGFSNSGSALDLLRSSASEGALQKQVLGQQGLITEDGYNEQTKSYNNLAGYARYAAGVQDNMADEAETAGQWSAAIKGVTAVASLFTGLPTSTTWNGAKWGGSAADPFKTGSAGAIY